MSSAAIFLLIMAYLAVGFTSLVLDLDSYQNYDKPFLTYLLFWPITLSKAIYRAFVHAIKE